MWPCVYVCICVYLFEMGIVVYMWDFMCVKICFSTFRNSGIFPFDKNPTFDFLHEVVSVYVDVHVQSVCLWPLQSSETYSYHLINSGWSKGG